MTFNIIKTMTAATLAALLLAGCVTGDNQKQVGGTLVGAGLGALAGSQVGGGRGQLAAVAIGALAGAFIGSEVGQSLDRADRLHAQQAQQVAYSAPIGQPIEWNNPQSGNYGSFTPTREGTNTYTGAYCREYQTTITVGGRSQSGYGTACQQPNGDWQVTQ